MFLLFLFSAGVFSATLGSLLGAGGGFVLIPILLFLLPEESPVVISGMSMALALTNSTFASINYGRQKRIRYRWGMVLATGSVTGATAGAWLVQYLDRTQYQGIFGLVLIGVCVYLLARPVPRPPTRAGDTEGIAAPVRILPTLTLGIAVGFVAGLVGIGGGIILVPAAVHLYSFAPHIATATSQFTIVFTSFTALAVRAAMVDLGGAVLNILALIAGAIVGAQIGPALSRRVSEPWLMRVLASSLGLVGVRLAASLLT